MNGLIKWRSEIAFVAILVVAALHFTFQFSFIRSEKIEKSSVNESQVIVNEISEETEQVQEQAVKDKPAEFRIKKTDDAKPLKPVVTVTQSQTKIAPSKSLPKKKIPVESRAARLRRAEKILTGI